MPDKSNAEIAPKDYEAAKAALHLGSSSDFVPAGYSVEQHRLRNVAKAISSARSTAQADLARQVLSEIDSVSAITINAIGIKQIAERKVRDLFTRLGIKIEE